MTEPQPSPAENPAQPSGAAEAHAHTHTGIHPHEGPMFSLKNILWLTFFLALSAATRCANYRNIFITSADGRQREIYYIDGDCYSRMTRVREILEGWGIVHYHPWENYPFGVFPHTTAPMDWLIAGLALLLKPFMSDYLDVAGAFISPILGLMTTAFLALWARELNQKYRRLMLLLVSLSPILVHGTSLGRPAHHSLQIFLLAVGIGAELIMARAPCISWGIVSGIAWGLALWVSLYEPLVLFLVIYVTKLIFYRPKLFVKERLWGLGCMAAILALAYFLEGKYLVKSFSIELNDPIRREYLPNWLSTIGEMQPMNIFSDLLYTSVGFGLLAAPMLLIARLKDTKRSTLLLALLVSTFALTLTEGRWSYFLALVFAMSLPWQLSLFKRKWIIYTLFAFSLWPVARDWEYRLFPDEAHDLLRVARLNDQRRIRQAAEFIKEKAPGAILAPWWWSPELVYWSGQPALAGSSHESLPGIIDTARFFSTTDPKVAEDICNRRYVETVVTGEPANIVSESVQTLGQPEPADEDATMAGILWTKPHSAPMFLHIVFDNNVVKVFEVNHRLGHLAMSEDGEFDFIVIGGGSGGYAGAALAAQLGLKVALVEGAREMGGLCILRGCMPSKTLIQSANRFMTLRRARDFGLRAENIQARGEEIIERKRNLVAEFAAHRRQQLECGLFELVRGWAKFAGPHTLEVNGETPRRLRAKSFLIATGSALKLVNIPGLKETGFLDSDAVLESAHIPKSVIMLGAGPIALEFAHYYSALGSDVTIIQRGVQVLRDMDGDVAMAASDALCARGVKLYMGTTLTRVEKCAAGKRVIFQHDMAERSAEAEEIVYGLGRAPNIDGLGLEAAGVHAQHSRLSVSLKQQTNIPHIFAAGDAAGPHEIVHIAIQQAEIAARNARRLVRETGEPLEEIDYRLKLFVAFTEPQVAAIGFSERELMTANAPYAVARYSFADHGKAMVLGETDGFVKLIASTGICEILGAAAVGPEAGELIHELAAAMYFRATAHDFLRIPHYHPTLSEIWTYPAEELVMA